MASPQTLADYHRARAWVFFVLYCGLIFFLSHQPGNPNLVPPFPHFDKFVHTMEYLVFAIFLSRAFNYSGKRKIVLLTIGAAILYGISDEFHQYFIPHRSCDWRDLIADGFGATVGTLIYQLTLPQRSRDPSFFGARTSEEA